MPRPAVHSVDVKLKIVRTVLSGESTQAEAARRHGISETSIGKWKQQFLDGGRGGLEQGDRAGKPDQPRAAAARRGRRPHQSTRGGARRAARAQARGPGGHVVSLSWRGCASSTVSAFRVVPDRRAARSHLLRPPRPPSRRPAGPRAVADAGARRDPRRSDRDGARLSDVGAPQDRVVVTARRRRAL
jgi:transposase-like protein